MSSNFSAMDAANASVEQVDTGLGCLVMMAGFHGLAADSAKIRHEAGDGVLFDRSAILLTARSLGLSARQIPQDLARLHVAPLPAIGQDKDGRYFIVGKFEPSLETDRDGGKGARTSSSGRILLQYPGQAPEVKSVEAMSRLWTGDLIFFKSKASFAGEVAKFDFTWFIPSIIKYRKLLAEVLLISLVLQVIGLITPMFFQVVMDKVLVNHAINTLNIVAIGLVLATLFETVLTAIRTYVFSHTSSKIDVELGARLFKHLLNLPISFFQSRRVGDSVARLHELENIRSFLTGNAMTLVMDVLFSFIFLSVMFWYSLELTVIVALSIPVYLTLSVIFTPILRRKLGVKFNKSAENQSFLVETISGIDTIKSLAVEPRWQRKWEEQLAGYVAAGLAASNTSTIASSSVALVSKLTTVAIMWVGASLAIEGKLTVGELVAFNMLAGQVASPILRLAQLWSDFQQIGISMGRLGDILNTRTEISGQKTHIARLVGSIEFDGVSFRYRPELVEVIREVAIKIDPGEVIGIVGRSGSGKSTLTKLIQRLYVPGRGRILIDGQDISVIDTTSLRQQIGVVLQENNLFAGTVRDNIALSNPTYSVDAVMAAAMLAGAHEFICELPEGYDTRIGEHGSGLSGGQRQRIAIARALISNPRILIFDEATSALDYESEKVIQDNMRRICAGRTVLIIAHRLSAVRDANRIMVVERGQVVEMGGHDELLRNPGGIYAHLHRLQTGVVSDAPAVAEVPADMVVA